MKRNVISGVAVAALTLASLVGLSVAVGADAEKKAQVGAPAPDFELKDVYGKAFKLSDFKGRIVVLEWINKDCPVSHKKHTDGTMQGVLKDRAAKGVVWLAIDSTHSAKPENNRVYAAEVGLSYPILHDPDGKVGRSYGAKTTPHMFVIDKNGTLAYDGAIDDKDKTNYVLAAIDDLLADRKVKTSTTTPYGCSVKYK